MKNVMIIDDAITVRMYHRSLMEKCGFTVTEAENGIEGLEKVLTQPCDLLIVDVNMPKMDGYRFTAEVRKHPEICHLPIIMVSTEAEPRDKQRALGLGSNHYIVKPASPPALITNAKLLIGVL